MFVDKSRTYIGIVEDNNDPKKLGRCRVRVVDIFDDIPADDIPWASPWKDLNGNAFNLPEKGKVLTVIFDSGNIYKPEYIYAEHYNINLEKKLSKLDGTNYTSMKSLIFDHKTQIFVNDGEGLVIDHKMNQINIKNKEINFNLKDNGCLINLGHESANQQAILGTNFLNWFDDFVSNLLGEKSGPYLGNLGAPVVANPELIECLQKYRALKDPKFLSHNVNLNDNKLIDITPVKLQSERIQEGQIGDTWKSTVSVSGSGPGSGTGGGSSEPVDFKPTAAVPLKGNLTPSSDPSTPNPPYKEPEIPPSTRETNDDGQYILEQVAKIKTSDGKPYEIFTRPFELNLIGIRYQLPPSEYSNKFVDKLYVIYRNEQNAIKAHCYPISTLPGLYGNQSDKKAGRLFKDRENFRKRKNEGLGTLMLGQYKGWRMSTHSGEFSLNPPKQLCHRDRKYGSKQIEYSVSNQDDCNNRDKKGNIAGGTMLIHAAFKRAQGTNTYGVFNWSEGCQVLANPTHLDQLQTLCKKHAELYGGKFTYTLISNKDVPQL